MNDIYDNNMRFIPLLKFLDKHKYVLFASVATILLLISFFVVSNQISKQKHNEAASIYSKWLIEISKDDPDLIEIDNMLSSFVNDYQDTGYALIALLTKANLDAKNGNLDSALVNFNKIIEFTDGYRGNKVFNKLARVSSARINLSNGQVEEALEKIQGYSSTDTNAYIHELTGDILAEQNKSELAIKQYQLASEKYSDQTSKSIISMKIANLDNGNE